MSEAIAWLHLFRLALQDIEIERISKALAHDQSRAGVTGHVFRRK